ncbi:GOLPH3/VPS74 family protein [Streptomyces sp. DSM 40750]|uniref:GOLPH3/VPS74 family protein n=1 Tax=Streptomyces sp. DSM 40750 TaxID=2801030 RepID=UPI00214B7566|nr:GPP34 family phosphoprotein [Streptomyces sp. DSM 40750]UUU23530.1 GPP34 family phosphoprotein [Streptomyces sp. DSM 40750]
MTTPTATTPVPTPTTLGEEILLLALDDTTGEARLPLRTPYAIAAAALLERSLADDTDDTARTGGVGGAAGTDGSAEAVLPDDAEKWISEHRTEEYEAALQGLLAKGLIRKEKRRVLLVFRTTSYPELDGTVETALRRRLAKVVLEGAEPDSRTAALITLLHHGELHTLAFPDADSDDSPVKRRMTEMAERHWADPALRRMAETAAATSAALTAATMVTTVVVITTVT